MPHLKDITTETGMVFSANYTTAPGGGMNNEVSAPRETNPFKTETQTYSTHDSHANSTNNSNFREEQVEEEEDLVGV